MYRIVCFLFVAILSFQSQAQSVVEGKVLDARIKTPLAGVRVLAQDTQSEVFTDNQGGFSLQLSQGKHVLVFFKKGYVEKKMIAEVSSGLKTEFPTVYLEADLIRDAEQQLVVISETDLEDDESSADMMSGLLQSSQDIFMRRAAFDFGAVFFKPRGFDSKDATVMINGIPMNRIENGRAQWSNWGGLNDVTRNQELSVGLNPSDYTFGGAFGSNYINIRPSLNRPGLRLSASVATASYTGRGMATYNSGMNESGLAYTISASRRWAPSGGYVDGTLYNAYSVFGAVEYEINPQNSLNLVAMFTPNRRGKSSPLTREVIDLAGYDYNPMWGYQNGDIRNSRNKIVSEPIFILSYNYEKENTRLDVNLGYQFGTLGNTRISYGNGQNPEPNYYRNLPSYYLNQTSGPNQHLADLQKTYFLENKQLDWASLYRANANATDSRSIFILSNDVNQERTFTGNINFSTPLHERITWRLGATYRNIYSDNYAQIDDLLGGKFFTNYDYFTSTPYDVNDPNLNKSKGDKWSYFYGLTSHVGEAYTQLEFDFNKLNFFVSGRYHYTEYEREGKFNYPLYKDSFGKGEKPVFNGVSTKAGFTYAITGRHLLQFNTGYINTPQAVRNTFANIRNSNRLLPNLKNETVYSADGSYILRMPYLKSRLTGYFAQIENTSETNFFFTEASLAEDVTSEFLSQTIEGIKKRHFGLEFGLEAQIVPTVKVTAVAAVGQHTYANNPSMVMSSGEIGIRSVDKVALKNYRVASGPQQAYSLGVEYRSPKYWWVAATGNFLARNYVSLSAINRSPLFFIDPKTKSNFTNIDKDLARELLKQERLDDVFLMNVIGGKSWRAKGKYISLFAGINNVLGQEFVSGGFEQSRKATYEGLAQDRAQGTPSFGPRYFVGYGRTYFVNLALSL
ncbi:carboxypeptidase-like regulatory domain-containing protein [Capnocytophaga canimorsus]|uniref:carboxypeptidase-like regulatory domain-containing protein n=1 Tax=Capnocytophaga canimorsus TaxID=28188 RepID=UPI0037D42786